MTAQNKLKSRIDKNHHICVGLDSDIKKIPSYFTNSDNPILNFNKAVIDSTYEHAAAYKINFAFYENWGIEGLQTLIETIEYIPNDILIIADAKRGDIGNTSQKYAESVFDHLNCDSVTLHPYMGYESVAPFLNYKGKINFILGLTSNQSANDFEKIKLADGRFVYQEVISKTNEWNTNNNCGLVFGATNLNELIDNIDSFNAMPILLPGVGAQGGSLEDVVKTFRNNNKQNYIINVSRGLIYADSSKNFPDVVEKKIIEYNQTIQNLSTK